MTATLTYRDGAALITLNRPEAMNALNAEMIDTLGALIDEVGRSDAHVLIVVGAGGKAFCAGADVKGILGKDADAQREFARFGQHTFARLDALRIPSIAVITGVAFGGGLELAMACTFRVATPAARLALPEIKLGLIPGYGGTQRLSRLVGPARALEMVTTGRAVNAEEAVRSGLVNTVEDGRRPGRARPWFRRRARQPAARRLRPGARRGAARLRSAAGGRFRAGSRLVCRGHADAGCRRGRGGVPGKAQARIHGAVSGAASPTCPFTFMPSRPSHGTQPVERTLRGPADREGGRRLDREPPDAAHRRSARCR